MQKKSLKLTVKTLGFLLIPAVFLFFSLNKTEAAVGLSVGNSGLNLGATENLFYGNIGAASNASSSFLLFQNNSLDKLRIDISGNLTTAGAITAGAFSGPITGGSISAANVSAGDFGSNVGGGVFSFPNNVGIGVTNPAYKLDVNGIIKSSTRVMVESAAGTAAQFLADEFGATEAGLYFSGGQRIATYNDLDAVYQYADGLIYSDSVNIGIGTATPAYKLDVSGTGRFTQPVIVGARLSLIMPLLNLMWIPLWCPELLEEYLEQQTTFQNSQEQTQ